MWKSSPGKDWKWRSDTSEVTVGAYEVNKAPHVVGEGGVVMQCRLMGGRSVGCCCANRWDSRESIFSLIVFWAINQKHFQVESYSIRFQHSSLGVVSVWRNSGFAMTQVGCEGKLKYSSEIHTAKLRFGWYTLYLPPFPLTFFSWKCSSVFGCWTSISSYRAVSCCGVPASRWQWGKRDMAGI